MGRVGFLFVATGFALLILSASIATATASYVSISEPFNATVYNGSTVFLGKVGPGQTFYVTISAATTNATGTLLTRGWNQLIATNVPNGWIVENSSLNDAYLSVKISAAPDAQNGTYYFNLTAINTGNYSKIGKLTFTSVINVTPDVFQLGVTPTNISAGPGQPAPISITINNTGVSDSPFIINATGLPAWNLTVPVIALHHTQETYTYPIYESEPGVYQAQIIVISQASPLVYKRSNITLAVQASVQNDYKAIAQGALAFPIVYEPVYAIMNIISKLLGG